MTIFSGVQPTGELTLGNYLGAIKNFSNDYEGEQFFSIVNLHAMTTEENPKSLKENTYSIAAWYIALGLDKKANLFIQSEVPHHLELSWILGNLVSVGELSRMTQYKSKSEEKINSKSTLLTYPILMAADIMLYKATHIPVGKDQKQHIELTRNITEKFNNKYGETFPECQPVINDNTSKIMSLVDPDKKMSKSDKNLKSKILLLDSADQIKKKIKSATTDSLSEINYNWEEQPGVTNLISIYCEIKKISIAESLLFFKDKNYGFLKEEVANAIIEELIPLQKKYFSILEDQELLESILEKGKREALKIAENNLAEIKKKVGLS